MKLLQLLRANEDTALSAAVRSQHSRALRRPLDNVFIVHIDCACRTRSDIWIGRYIYRLDKL